MTNWQLFISAGLPSLLVLLSIWRSDKRMDQIESRQDRTDAKIEGVRAELLGVRSELGGRIDRIADDLKMFYRTLGQHDEAIETLKKK